MPLTVLDPRTGTRVTLTLSGKKPGDHRARNWVLGELDRLADQQKQPARPANEHRVWGRHHTAY